MPDFVRVGQVTGPFGLAGAVKVYPLTDFDDRFAARHAALEFTILDELHFRPLAEHFRILHPRFVMSRLERCGLIDQHHRYHVLEADIRHFPVVHDGCFFRGDSHIYVLHLVRVERMFFE